MSVSRAAALGCAIGVPGLGLPLLIGSNGSDGMTLPLLGWPRLWIAHLVLALPLAWLLAARIRQWWNGVRFVSILGIGSLMGVVLLLPSLAESARTGGQFVPLLLLRTILAVFLMIPWCMLASNGAAEPLLRLGACGLAIIPVGFYTDALLKARTDQVRDWIERERLVRAAEGLGTLLELGSDWPIGGRPPRIVEASLVRRIESLKRVLERPLPIDSTPIDQVNRALTLIQLNQVNDAIRLLQPLANGMNTETLLLATAYQDQRRWEESNREFLRVKEHAIPRSPEYTTAIEGLLHNARESRESRTIEALLFEAVAQHPERAADYHFQLGQHFTQAGRPATAIEHFDKARELDPRYVSRARLEIDALRASTPTCILPR